MRRIFCGCAFGIHLFDEFFSLVRAYQIRSALRVSAASRITHLAEQNCPPAIARYWIGHATSDIHERYNHLSENVALRRELAERIGLGFRSVEATQI
jgi:hypothetical protein